MFYSKIDLRARARARAHTHTHTHTQRERESFFTLKTEFFK